MVDGHFFIDCMGGTDMAFDKAMGCHVTDGVDGWCKKINSCHFVANGSFSIIKECDNVTPIKM